MNFKATGTNMKAMFSLDPREKKLAFAMFAYNYILLITLYLLKPVRDSLFLEQVGAQQLPFVFLLAALVVIPVSLGYSRLSKRLSIGWLINIITIFLSANLIIMWMLIRLDMGILYYAFYIWISIYSVLITSQFWLFANTIFNSVQAKKLFAFLSLGAIAGAFTGGEMTGIFMDLFSLQPETLLPVSAAVLIVTIPIVNWVLILKRASGEGKVTFKEKREKVAARSKNPVTEILQNSHLLLIMSLIAISVVATTIIDFQFKSVVESSFTSEAALTSFMGRFYGRVSLIAFLIQFFIGSYFTKKYGITGSILLLPIALFISSAAMLIIPGLFMATLTRGIDQTFKHSIDRTGRELLFMPLATQLKKRVKVFVDLFVKHGAQGLAGLLLIGLTYGLGFDVRSLGVVVVLLVIAWIVIARMASKSYIEQLRTSIKKQVNTKNGKQHQKNKSPKELSLNALLYRLRGDEDRGIIESLTLAKNSGDKIPSSVVTKLLKHPNPKVRSEVLRHINRFQNDDWTEKLKMDYKDGINPEINGNHKNQGQSRCDKNSGSVSKPANGTSDNLGKSRQNAAEKFLNEFSLRGSEVDISETGSEHSNRKEFKEYLSPRQLTKTIRPEVVRYSKLIKISALIRQNHPNHNIKLLNLIENEIEQSSKNIFKLLSLNHKQEDITNAYRAISGSDPDLRAEAVEFVENLFSWEIRKLIFPILDNYPNRDGLDNEFTAEFDDSDEIISFLNDTLHTSLDTEMAESIEQIIQNDNDIV